MNANINYNEPIKNFNEDDINEFIANKLNLITGQIMFFDDNIQITCYSETDTINVILENYSAFAMIKNSPLSSNQLKFINSIEKKWQSYLINKLGKTYADNLKEYERLEEEKLSLNP